MLEDINHVWWPAEDFTNPWAWGFLWVNPEEVKRVADYQRQFMFEKFIPRLFEEVE